MKFYIASRTAQIPTVQEMIHQLQGQGHEITFDWTHTGAIDRPYSQHKDEVVSLAQEEINGIRTAEVFVIISDREGTGMYLELGVAISEYLNTHNPKIYVIGEYNEVTVFHFLPFIKHVNTFEDVLADVSDI